VKFLLVLLVVGVGLWMLVSRVRGPGADADRTARRKPDAAKPVVMVECAHCGLHLPAADAVTEGSRLYCTDAHRRLGPASGSPPSAPHNPPT
jgi:uncharacterized protein